MKKAQMIAYSICLTVTVFAVQSVTSLAYGVIFGQLDSLETLAAGAVAVLITAIGSGLAYKAVVSMLESRLARSEIFMKWLLKGAYLKGTWIAELKVRNDRKVLAVEYFEQTPFELTIRGSSFDPSGSSIDPSGDQGPEANWVTRCVDIKPEEGRLYCLYETEVKGKPKLDRRDGIGNFHFGSRDHPYDAPQEMYGEAIDSLENYRIEYEKVIRIDRGMLPLEKAKRQAMERFAKAPNDPEKAGERVPPCSVEPAADGALQ